MGDLVKAIDQSVSEAEVAQLIEQYEALYEVAPDLRAGGEKRTALHEAARIEIGMRRFLEKRQFQSLYHHL